MSCEPIKGTRIVCDTCGERRDDGAADATGARIAASRDGWKYAVWDLKGKGYQAYRKGPSSAGNASITVPRQWDCCRDCQMPESPLEAKRIRESRMMQNRAGRWVESEADLNRPLRSE